MADILIYTGNKVMYTNAETGGLFANGDTLTGSATGATGTIVDIASVTDEILGSQRKIVYNRYTCLTQALIQLQMAQQQQHLILRPCNIR